MNVPKELKERIISDYNNMAKQIYRDFAHMESAPNIRLMITQTITNHAMSKHREDLTTAKRVTKNKVTRKINKIIKKTPEPKEHLEPITIGQDNFLENLLK